MERPLNDQGMGDSRLVNIHEGMDVYDAENKKIGEVETVFFGDVSQDEARRGAGPATPSDPELLGEEEPLIDFAFGGTLSPSGEENELEVIRDRLLREGFVKVDSSGLFGGDYYVTPDQVVSVSGDQVRLNVRKDELIER